MKFSTTIKKKYWDMKMEDLEEKGHFYEYKVKSPYWETRINRLKVPCDGVFLVGSEPHRVRIVEITEAKTAHIPERYADGLINTEYCYILKCIEPPRPTGMSWTPFTPPT